ncbi:hypothetical protein [Vagococcus fluvialis]|uniref:hypothetical protein n=1 Tax=Vagococcus fluvialis TaxID=2738 RepID=UPI001D0A131A|nr:hypothetical protein [Vagococcus fluvialis]UDM72628.1 hypothetical protein K5L00_14670 [Vagococcus fluvialis]UDM78351.1 hypothetical protein K5K98_14875 [Vagococcus fluvialis]UDM83903.1 hypothetical protein K5K96_14695 [Vagococcus fluvialis]
MSKKKSELSGWHGVIDGVFERQNKRNFGYNQMTLNYINDCASTIQRLSTEMNWAWVNRDSLNMTDEEKANYFVKVKKELDRSIELLKTYSEPVEENE